jgi:hypothetical protein
MARFEEMIIKLEEDTHSHRVAMNGEKIISKALFHVS